MCSFNLFRCCPPKYWTIKSLHSLSPLFFYLAGEIAQELKELKCRKCGLQQVNTTLFDHIPSLMELDLGDNEVTIDFASQPTLGIYLPSFCLPLLFLQLKYLVDDAFANLRRLITLRLDGNQLSGISADLLPMHRSLEHLGECCFSHCEQASQQKKTLTFFFHYHFQMKWIHPKLVARPHLCSPKWRLHFSLRYFLFSARACLCAFIGPCVWPFI